LSITTNPYRTDVQLGDRGQGQPQTRSASQPNSSSWGVSLEKTPRIIEETSLGTDFPNFISHSPRNVYKTAENTSSNSDQDTFSGPNYYEVSGSRSDLRLPLSKLLRFESEYLAHENPRTVFGFIRTLLYGSDEWEIFWSTDYPVTMMGLPAGRMFSFHSSDLRREDSEKVLEFARNLISGNDKWTILWTTSQPVDTARINCLDDATELAGSLKTVCCHLKSPKPKTSKEWDEQFEKDKRRFGHLAPGYWICVSKLTNKKGLFLTIRSANATLQERQGITTRR